MALFLNDFHVMRSGCLAAVTSMDVAVFSVAILAVFVLLLAGCIFAVWLQKNHAGTSPYTGLPLRRAADIPYESAVRILRYLYNLHQFDNRIFKLKNASFCRETGRIFTNSVTWYGIAKVDWDFLQKKLPGQYVSWGSLTETQQEDVMMRHESLEGFQTDFSSPTPSPRTIEKTYAFLRPGPLYVDLNTKVLIGWKNVPETSFEVLIVQHPKKIHKYSSVT